MNLIVLLGLALGSLFGLHSKLAQVGLFFIGAQLVTCYLISGVSKLLSPVWRKSYAMNAVFSTKTYGHPLIYDLIRQRPWIAHCASWSVMLFESLFFVALFFDPWIGLVFLSVGFLFHLGNGLFMGLNDFLFAFLSSYPSFIYVTVALKA
jgi:hypothetical protein